MSGGAGLQEPSGTSGLMAVTAPSGVSSLKTPSTPMDVDPSSLRAAALLTLRSKRRKPATIQATSSVFVPPASPQAVALDYGNDEANLIDPVATPITGPKGGSREEGEISDEDDVPLPIVQPPAISNGTRTKPINSEQTALRKPLPYSTARTGVPPSPPFGTLAPGASGSITKIPISEHVEAARPGVPCDYSSHLSYDIY